MPQDVQVITLALPFHVGSVNCYLLRIASGFILIDTGGSNARTVLQSTLEAADCRPGTLRLVILTHGDFDHIGNAAYLHSMFGALIGMHHGDAAMAERGDMFANRKKPNLLIRALIPVFAGFGRTERFKPGAILEAEDDLSRHGLEARVISLPGHSKGSIGILTTKGDLFCGDLFDNRKRPALNTLIDDAVAANASATLLAGLNIRTVYPGHGEPFQGSELPAAHVR